MLELAGDLAKQTKHKDIIPQHIMYATYNDHELSQLVRDIKAPEEA